MVVGGGGSGVACGTGVCGELAVETAGWRFWSGTLGGMRWAGLVLMVLVGDDAASATVVDDGSVLPGEICPKSAGSRPERKLLPQLLRVLL